MLITLNQLKKSLQALKNFLLAKIPTKASDLVDDSGHYTKPSTGIPASDLASGVVPVQDVQINGTSIIDSGVANIPIANMSNAGVVKVGANSTGLATAAGFLIISSASSSMIKNANAHTAQPIIPATQHESAFYGLAKAAGDTTQSASSNAVGTYTDEAKTAIKTMLGIDTITVDSIPTTEIDTLFA